MKGKFRGGSNGGRFGVYDPATEQVLASVADGTIEDAQAAVDAAAAAFDGWAARSPRERGDILRKAFDLFSAQKEKFARLMPQENGKSRTHAHAEATYAADVFPT